MLSKLKKNYFLLISTFLILYFFFNLLDGERGLFSYFKKKEIFNISDDKPASAEEVALYGVKLLGTDKPNAIEISDIKSVTILMTIKVMLVQAKQKRLLSKIHHNSCLSIHKVIIICFGRFINA